MMAKWRLRSKEPFAFAKSSKILIVLAIVVGALCWHFSKRTPVMFSVNAISSNLSYNPEWETPPANQEVRAIFTQKFKYLARGAQSFAFVSEDGRYVIKFFRMKHLQSKFKDHFRPGVVKRRSDNLQSIFSAHKLAWDELKEETGLVFIHLNKTDDLQTTLHVSDWLGRAHRIDLDKTEFVVQERAELIFTRIQRLHAKGDKEGLKRAISSFLTLVQTQIDRNIFDRDKAISHNYGFVGEKPVHLDIGRLAKGEKAGEYERIKTRLEKWMRENGVTVS